MSEQQAMAGQWQHLLQDHRDDPATVARDVPDPEIAGFIHDAAHMYPDAPWGEVVVRGQAGAWWQARDWEHEPQPTEEPAAWGAFFREVLGLDMPRNAEHEARLKQLEAADLLTREMWTNGPDGTSYLHGFDAAALAAERGGLSFPHLYQQRYLQLSAGRRKPESQKLTSDPAQLAAASFPGPVQPGARLPARRSGRPPGATSSPTSQARRQGAQ